MASKFHDYHFVWLAAHPDRSEEWLSERMKDGFDIHHMDGDKANCRIDNLVLIEHLDHMRLHGSNGNRLAAIGRWRKKRGGA